MKTPRLLAAALLVAATGACYTTRAYTPEPHETIARVRIAFDSATVDLANATVQDSVFTGTLEQGNTNVEYLGPAHDGKPVVRVDARHARVISALRYDPTRTSVALGVVGLLALAIWSVVDRAEHPVVC